MLRKSIRKRKEYLFAKEKQSKNKTTIENKRKIKAAYDGIKFTLPKMDFDQTRK